MLGISIWGLGLLLFGATGWTKLVGIGATKVSISHGETLSGLIIDAGSSHWTWMVKKRLGLSVYRVLMVIADLKRIKHILILTFNERHLEHSHWGDMSSTPTIVPVNLIKWRNTNRLASKLRDLNIWGLNNKSVLRLYLLSGESSPSNRILNRMPTVNPLFTASIYLFKPMMNWLVLKKLQHTTYSKEKKTFCSLESSLKQSQDPPFFKQPGIIPWLVVNRKPGLGGNSMWCSCKHSKMHALAWNYWRWHGALLTS